MGGEHVLSRLELAEEPGGQPVKVAVFGSREGISAMRVNLWIAKLWDKQGPDTTLVSGGAPGVDTAAEQTWLAFGGQLVSFRPKKLSGDLLHEDVWGVEVWKIGGEQQAVYVPREEPTFSDFKSAANYRDLLIAEYADRGVAFWNGRSRGTSGTIDAFRAEGKPVHVFKEESPVVGD